jgi:transglutaminase-like putative cysteine protease
MKRRAFMMTGLGVSMGATLPGLARSVSGAAGADPGRWRVFEVTTRAEIVNASGPTKVWLPLPLTADTDYQKSLGLTWSGNAAVARPYRDDKYGAGLLYAEWGVAEPAPVVEATARFATRDRTVDPAAAAVGRVEDRKTLKVWLEPTQLLPTDGIVRKTAQDITRGQRTDVEKARAIYEWIVDNTFRDPKVRGCGIGDIRGMLETRNLGGKCADLNALFVGLARSVGIPARDVYGVRVADSATYKSLGKSGDITKAQHCRAEFHTAALGWVPVDPADVRKVVLEERPSGLALDDPIAQNARAKLFGAWEMNWLAFNYAHDFKLPGAAGEPLAFFMYPQAEVGGERRDSLDPDAFRYRMTARELAG